MKATEQKFPVVLFIMLTRWFYLLSLWMKFLSVTIQMKATEEYFPVVLFIMLTRQAFESVDKILKCDHSNESYWAVLSCGAVYYAYAPIKSKLQHPPPGQTPGIWLFSVPGEWGIWRIRPSRGWGIWPCLGGVEKIEPEVSGFKFFFSGAEVANSYKHVFGRDGRVWRKRYSICERLTYKKRSSKVRVFKY